MQPGVDAFVIFEKKVLLILRDDNSAIQHPNMWSLPGGGIEEKENSTQAILRELEEEINLVPQNLHLIDTTSYPDGNLVTRFWVPITDQEKSELRLKEGQRMEFFSFEDVLSLKIIPNLKTYLE